MHFDYEKLHVYQVGLEFVGTIFEKFNALKGIHASPRDHLIRASQSIILNIAEGNAKRSERARIRFFEIARGSAMECAAVLDVFVITKACPQQEVEVLKSMLTGIVAMLSKMVIPKKTQSPYVREDIVNYGDESDYDYDNDYEHEEERILNNTDGA